MAYFYHNALLQKALLFPLQTQSVSTTHLQRDLARKLSLRNFLNFSPFPGLACSDIFYFQAEKKHDFLSVCFHCPFLHTPATAFGKELVKRCLRLLIPLQGMALC